jgi:hypothetical protein
MPHLLVLIPSSPAAIDAFTTSPALVPLRPGGRLLIGRAPASELDSSGKSDVLVLSALPVSGRHCALDLNDVCDRGGHGACAAFVE